MPTHPDTLLRIHATLIDIEPAIWRRIELSGRTSLKQLHGILQIAFGWEDCHMHQFEKGKQRYGVVDPNDPFDLNTLPEAKHTLGQLLVRKGNKLIYWYDFGDDWFHEIKLEALIAPEPGLQYPRITDGARRCPPEDCGGTYGYENLLLVLTNKKHPQHRDLHDWVGSGFDPEAFSVADTNKRLARKRTLAPKP
jgi:hypothetical protein